MQKVRWQTCNVLGFKQCWFQCFKRQQKSVAKLGKESRLMTTLPSGLHSSVEAGSPTGCPSAGVCQRPIVCFIWKGQSPHCAQRSHGHPADEQQTEAEKWSLNPWVPFTQMQSLCAVLSKHRMRRADAKPADGLSETAESWALHREVTAGDGVVSAQRARHSLCVLRNDATNYHASYLHLLLTVLGHPCFLFQSGWKAPSLLSKILNTSVNTQAIISPSF